MTDGRFMTLCIVGFVGTTLLALSLNAKRTGKKLWEDEYAEPKKLEPEPVECFDCHAIIPVGKTRCSHCGWTFET